MLHPSGANAASSMQRQRPKSETQTTQTPMLIAKRCWHKETSAEMLVMQSHVLHQESWHMRPTAEMQAMQTLVHCQEVSAQEA